MPNEITINAQYNISKGTLALQRTIASAQFDLAGANYTGQVQTIPTTAGGTEIDITSGVGDNGLAYFRNIDATNYIEVGIVVSATFHPFMRLQPGQWGLCFLGHDVEPFARANTASANLEYFILER